METLLHAALSNAVTAAFLALLVACLTRVLARRPAVLHCLWLLVLIKLLSPPLYQVPIPWPESLSASEQREARIQTYFLEELEGASTSVPGNRDAVVLSNEISAGIGVGSPAAPGRATLYDQIAPSVTFAREWLVSHWMPIVALIWLAGSAATAVVCARRIHRFQRLLRESRPASQEIQDWVDDLAASLGITRPPQVVWIGGRLSPMLWALGRRSRLIIPRDLWKGLKEQERATLIVHELAHLRRGDHFVRVFELLVTVLCWWNPVLWWARQALRDVEEQCCDAWVVWAFPEAARSYAETLLETLDFLNQSELSEPLLASGFGKVHHLRRRLTMIMSGTTPRLVSVWGGLGSLCLAVLLLPVNATWAQKHEERQDVRVIVKTEDHSSKPETDFVEIRSPDGTTIMGTVLTVDLVGDVKVDGPGTLKVDPIQLGKHERFVLELQDGDADIKVAADTPEAAQTKIIERLKTLKEKSSLSEEDKSLLKVLEQVLEQVKKIKSSSNKTGSLSAVIPDGKTTTNQHVILRRVEYSGDAAKNPASKAEIGKLRDEVKKLAKQLAEAQSKLSKLEGNNAATVTFVTPGTKVEKRFTVTRPVSETTIKEIQGQIAAKPGSFTVVPDVKVMKIDRKSMNLEGLIIKPDHHIELGTKVAGSDEQRIQDLERMLKELMGEVDSLKKARAK